MSIYLIRHGKTEANEKHLYCGSTDIPLSSGGKAELNRRNYRVHEDSVFITSGMQRCNETLEILFGNVPFEIEPDFREIDFGIFEMKSYEQLKILPSYQKWIEGNNDTNVPPGGESGEQMARRCIAAFEKIAGTGKHTVIISHGGVIAAIMTQRFPEENKNLYQWQPAPGCGYMLEGRQYFVLK